MNRGEIITRFRQENPEITTNVASDAVLQSWCEVGDQEIATRVRLVRSTSEFTAVIGVSTYNLTNEITNFYDIDEYPGGGVAFDDNRIVLETKSSLDAKRPAWRSASNGTPKDYYRRQQNLIFGTPPDAASTIDVDTVLIPNPLDDDTKIPFNELTYLEPFHYSLVLYLKMRAFNGKVKKKDMGEMSRQELEVYINWMKKEVDRGTYSSIQIRPKVGYSGSTRYYTAR